MAHKHGLEGAIVQPGNEVVVDRDGRANVMPHVSVTEEHYEQYRQGYRCLTCHHFPQPEPFPKNCAEPYCRYAMRDRQAEDFARQFKGHYDPWPTRRAEPDEAPAGWAKTDSNIVVPRSLP